MRTGGFAVTAVKAFFPIVQGLFPIVLGLRIVAPCAGQRTPFKKDSGADTVAVMYGIFLNVCDYRHDLPPSY